MSNAGGDAEACAAVARALPDHFTDDVPAKVLAHVGAHGAWLLTDRRLLLSFVVVERRGPAAEILWMATHPGAQRHGHGTHLLERTFSDLRAEGVELVEVKTLDASADYAPYQATRAFWRRMGFLHVDTIDPYPAWGPGNPCAIYVAALAARSRGAAP